MHCVSCATNIKKSLESIDGVTADVNFATKKAYITCEREDVDTAQLEKQVQKAGYRASEESPHAEHRAHASERIQALYFWGSLICTVPLVILHWWGRGLYVQIGLATFVQFGLGWPFYRSTFMGLRQFQANMDTLVALGTSAAYLLSLFVWILQLTEPLYFDASAMIITLIHLGRWLEIRAQKKATLAISELLNLQPKMADVQRKDEWVEIPIEELQSGDIYRVKPGASIPVDGEVLEGSSHVDESMITGESLAVSKRKGDPLIGGTINANGMLIAKATKVGKETVLYRIVDLVERAQGSKVPIQRLADKVSGVFVPIVLVISILTWILTSSILGEIATGLLRAVAVLVVACPCALGLATPVVIAAAVRLGAKRGIILRNAASLEHARSIKTLVLDKTGTVTEGKPQVKDVVVVSSMDQSAFLQVCCTLEEASEHPLAKAVVSYAQTQNLASESLTEFHATSGKGIQGSVGGILYFLGSENWLREKGLTLPQEYQHLQGGGDTTIILFTQEVVQGVFVIGDKVRETSPDAIRTFQNMGIECVLLTGDKKAAGEHLAKAVGISKAFTEVLPENKQQIVQRLQTEQKGPVAMVGDGINDAPALAASDVSFAMGSGTDVALETADITLMHSDLLSLVDALHLSKNTWKKCVQNLFFAFIYNILAIPLAAFGLLTPVIAAAAMSLSSLSVVGNALLLRIPHR